MAYRLDLFNKKGLDAVCFCGNDETVCGIEHSKVLQVKGAGGQGRVLAKHLIEVILCNSNIKQAY